MVSPLASLGQRCFLVSWMLLSPLLPWSTWATLPSFSARLMNCLSSDPREKQAILQPQEASLQAQGSAPRFPREFV